MNEEAAGSCSVGVRDGIVGVSGSTDHCSGFGVSVGVRVALGGIGVSVGANCVRVGVGAFSVAQDDRASVRMMIDANNQISLFIQTSSWRFQEGDLLSLFD